MPTRCTAATVSGRQCRCNARPNETLCGRHNNPNVVLYDQTQIVAQRCINCRRPPMDGSDYCRHHEALRPRPDLPPEQRCVERRCMRIAHAHNRCRYHEGRFIRREEDRVYNEMYRDGLNRLHEGPDTWQDVVVRWRQQRREPFVTNHLLEQLEVTLARDLHIPELWNMYMGAWAPMDAAGIIAWDFERNNPWEGMNPNQQPARGELEAFIRDGQNVHTRFVTEQTNSGLNILLNTDVPPAQRTVLESHVKFMEFTALGRIRDVSLELIDRVDRDVKRWYRMSTCRAQDDYLYKRVLDGLWTKIKSSSVHDELVIRLWQELVDSVGMCCDGHISRLTNVLCGFDEAFAPELSPAEKLQNRMSVIASMEGGIILQTAQALAAFRELNVPREQWEPWVDAL